MTFVFVEARFGVQFGPSHVHSGPAEAGKNCGWLCSSKQVAQGWAQAVPDIDLHQIPSGEVPEPKHPVAVLRLYQSTIQLPPKLAHPKGDLGRHQTLLGRIPLHGVIQQQFIYSGWG